MNEKTHLSADVLDQMKMDLLDPQAKSDAERHMQGCPRCRLAYEQLELAYQEFDQSVLPRTLDQVLQKAPGAKSSLSKPSWWLWPAMATAVAATGLLMFIMLTPSTPVPNQGHDVRIKGDPNFRVFAWRAGAVFAVKPQSVLQAGDRIRFVIEPGQAHYLMIVSRDGPGKCSLYYPPGAKQSGKLEPGQSELPGSIQLDTAQGPERLLAIFSKQPQSVEKVLTALKKLGDGPLPAHWLPGASHIAELVFQKESL